MGKLYIAYGSNLNLRQMALRCPTAHVYASGVLDNWELLFRGSPLNSHATIARCRGSHIPVLVWSIEPEDEKNLDVYEGYPRYYFKQDIMVRIGGRKKKAMVYIMNTLRKPGIPSESYVNTIRTGYVENDFDTDELDAALYKNYLECRR